MHRKSSWVGAAALALLLPLQAQATLFNYTIGLSGANEVNGGDPDGFGTAQITIDDSTKPYERLRESVVVRRDGVPEVGLVVGAI